MCIRDRVKPGGLFFASLYPGASVGGADAWTAKQAASLDDRPAFVAAMRACGFEEVEETRITEDMDLSSGMPPGARNAIWHQKILTIYLRRRRERTKERTGQNGCGKAPRGSGPSL